MRKPMRMNLSMAVASALSVGLMLSPTAAFAQGSADTSASTGASAGGNTADTNSSGLTEATSTVASFKVTAETKDEDNPGTVSLGFDYKDLEAGTYTVELQAFTEDGKEFGKAQGFDINIASDSGKANAEVKLSEDALPTLRLALTLKDSEGKEVLKVGASGSDELMIDNSGAGTDTPTPKPDEDDPADEQPGADVDQNTPGDDNSGRAPQIRTSANMDADVIQTGAMVSDTVRYEGLVPGKSYTLETRLMCKMTAEQTGDSVKSQFTAEASSGSYTVENIPVTDPDCLEQVVFEKLYDENGTLVATHEDLEDSAQTVGSEQRDGKKKKKNPDTSIPEKTPPAPTLTTPLGGAENPADPTPGRAMIGSVPSGETDGYGYTIFNR